MADTRLVDRIQAWIEKLPGDVSQIELREGTDGEAPLGTVMVTAETRVNASHDAAGLIESQCEAAERKTAVRLIAYRANITTPVARFLVVAHPALPDGSPSKSIIARQVGGEMGDGNGGGSRVSQFNEAMVKVYADAAYRAMDQLTTMSETMVTRMETLFKIQDGFAQRLMGRVEGLDVALQAEIEKRKKLEAQLEVTADTLTTTLDEQEKQQAKEGKKSIVETMAMAAVKELVAKVPDGALQGAAELVGNAVLKKTQNDSAG